MAQIKPSISGVSLVSVALIPAVVYVLLAAGTVFPFLAIGWFAVFYILVFFLFIALILACQPHDSANRSFVVVNLAMMAFFLIYLLSALRTFDAELTLRRLEGGGLVTGLLIAIIGVHIALKGQRAFQLSFLRLMLLLLLITVWQKSLTGFFDRDGRFLLNGPIVFGWFMGFSALTALYMIVRKELSGYWVIPLTAFLFALFWTQSKGPLLALILSATATLFLNFRLARARWALAILITAIIVGVLIVDEEGAGRLVVLVGLFSDQSVLNDSGSIAGRQGAWGDAAAIFLENPLFGVGVGNWQFHSTYGELQYPHNLILELAAETGIVGALSFFAVFAMCFFYSEGWGRLTLLFFLLCLSFSGDFSYLRFLFSIPIGSLLANAMRSGPPSGERPL